MIVHGWGSWRQPIPGGPPAWFRFEWRRPRIVRYRTTDRRWITWNTYPGCLIGVAIGLPRLSGRPGYPALSIMWGSPGGTTRRRPRW